jgi:hypothetical protein
MKNKARKAFDAGKRNNPYSFLHPSVYEESWFIRARNALAVAIQRDLPELMVAVKLHAEDELPLTTIMLVRVFSGDATQLMSVVHDWAVASAWFTQMQSSWQAIRIVYEDDSELYLDNRQELIEPWEWQETRSKGQCVVTGEQSFTIL